MQRFLYRALLFTGLLFMCTNLYAQDRKITGRVLTSDNRPLSGVTVSVGERSVMTDDNGNFSITAKQGDVIRFSSVGYASRTATVGTSDIIDIRLAETNAELDNVVVVAMDQRRKPRELGYSTQTVRGGEIAETQRENFLNSLQGRVAGLTINPTSGAPGASTSIVLRGFNSLALSNEPLFVIDGVIVDNQTVNETSAGGAGLGLASDRPNRNNDYTNRIADINPNDIESVTILKGPEATALYGSQASSGAIVITTKKAKSPKFALQYDNSIRLQKLTRYPETLNLYDNGNNGINSNVFAYFGPAYSPNTPIFQNVKTFFQTGTAQTHNVGMDFGIRNSIFRVSGSFFDQTGVVPSTGARRITGRISNTTKIGKFLELIPAFNYTRNENDKALRSAGGYLLSLLIWPSDLSVLNYKDDNGNKLGLFNSNPNADYDNPYFNVENNRSRDETNRYNMTLGVNLTPLKWLTVNGRFGYEKYNTRGYTLYHPQSFYITAGARGQLENYYRRYNGYNHTITATARRSFGDFNFRVMAGTMWQDYKTEMFAVNGTGLIDSTVNGIMYKGGRPINAQNNFFEVINPWDSSMTVPNSRSRLLRNNRGLYNYSLLRQFAYFGEFAVNYKELIYFNYTHRFEQASVIPKQNRKYNYPGASLSVIVSDLFKLQGKLLSYWKIRTSLAQTARLNDPYQTQTFFVNNFASPFGQVYSYGFNGNSPNLKPERQSTYEVGTEAKFFNNRFGIDATYYNTLNKDQIVQGMRLSYATGFVLITQNAATTRNQGVEISLDGTIINTAKFNWNTRVNFNRMWNVVESLPDNVAEFYNSDTWAYLNARNGIVKGGPTTTITANSYQRNNRGDILINPANGFPLTTGSVFRRAGDRNPDFTMGFLNNFRYKNWRFSMLWDLKVGGDIYNGTEQFLTRIGKSKQTADRFEPRIVRGVLRDGNENSANPTPNNIVIIPAYNDAYYTNLPDEEFIEKDVNWLRLRDVTISYTFPSVKLRYVRGLKSLGFFVTGNDLILITNYTGVDPAVNMNNAATRGVGGFGFDYGTLPTPMSVNFGIRAGF